LRGDKAQYERVGLSSLAWKLSSKVFSSMELQLFDKSDMLTAVSSHVFHELKAVYGLERKGILLGNGVDEQTFVPLENTRRKKGDYVLYVGRIDYRKGLFDLIRCAKYVCEEKPNISFVLVGNGPLIGLILRKASRMGIGRNIVFAGYVNRDLLVRLYQNASVSVLPSHYEGLPTVMLEAMSCGIPVVATRIGGHVDAISDGSNGFLVRAESPEEMAKYILRLLDDKNLRERMGRAARETIEKTYTWNKVSERALDCYERLLQQRDS